jgi:hypothetical protein
MLGKPTQFPPPAEPLRMCLAGLLVWLCAQAAGAAIITNVLPVNVTPTSFSILWRGVNSTSSIAVYADANGRTNLSGQLGIETLPLRTGDPGAAAGYDRRQNQSALQRQARGRGYMLMRVTGCQPQTTYYYRLSGSRPGFEPVVYPANGSLPSVTTEKENSFVVDDQLLVLDVPGFDSYGRIVTLSNANASYCLAAVVGDGVAGTNHVFFNTGELFLLAGGGNFSLSGPQQFTADVLGIYGRLDTRVDFTLTFGTNLTAATGTADSMHTDFLKISVGSVVLQTGQTTNVPVAFNSSANLAEVSFALDLPAGALTNLAWEGLAPELDPASATVTPQAPATYVLHLATHSGQSITGPREVGQLAFTANVQHSAFVPLNPQPLAAGRTDTTLVTNLFTQAGRAVVVGPEPLLEGAVKPGGARELTLYGNPPPSSYGVEYSTNLTSPMVWTPLPGVLQLTNLSASVPGIDPAADLIFYRAAELTAP